MRRRLFVLLVVVFVVMLSGGTPIQHMPSDSVQEATNVLAPDMNEVQILSDEPEVGFINLTEYGITKYLGSGQWQYNASIGEHNVWNGSHYVRYIYDHDNKQVRIGGLTFTHGTNGVIAINHTGSGFAIERLKWYAQYYYSGAWQNFTFDNYHFDGFLKTDDNVTVYQRWWSTNGQLNVSYTYTYWGELKMRAWATNWAAISVPVRILWAALGIQTSGVDYSLIYDNSTGTEVKVGVAIGNNQQLFWHDVIENTPQYAINTVVDKPNRRAAVVFGNMSSVLAPYETMDIDPTYTVAADSDDDEWGDGGTTHNTGNTENSVHDYYGEDYRSQFRVALAIPKSSTINSATLTIYVLSTSVNSIIIARIDETNVGSLEGDGAQPTPSASNTITQAIFTSAGSQTSNSISAMVQAQVNLAGWVSGYYMGIQMRTSGEDFSCGWEDHQHASTHHAYMTITFTPPNNAPTNDGTPTIATLDDTDNLFSRYRRYEVTTYHKDLDGYGDIDYVQFYVYNDARSVCYFYGRFDQDTHVFSEQGTTAQKNRWQLTGSTYSENVNDLDVTWKFYVEWEADDVTNMDVRSYVIDDTPASASNYYETVWDIETDLEYDTTPTITDDDAGSVNRGDLDEAFHITGDVSYQSSSLTPPSAAVDVMVAVTTGQYGTNAGPWEDDTIDAGGGFDVTCYADDEVGDEIYTIKVVKEGGTYGGTDLIGGADPTDTYHADRVYVSSMPEDYDRVNINLLVPISVVLKYDNGEELVTTGSWSLEGTALAHQGSGVWEADFTSSTVQEVDYNAVTGADTTHGITVCQNSITETVIYDRIQVQSYSVSDARDDINDNVDIDVTLWYDHDNTLVTDGTVTINGYAAAHQGSGVWRITRTSATVTSVTYNDVQCSGNTHGITVEDQNGQSTTVIWDRIQVQSYSVSDARDDINDNVDIDVTLWYDHDNTQLTDGTVTINGYSAAHQGSGVWRITRTSASVTSVTYNTVAVSGNAYGITEEDQNGQSTTVIWDSIGYAIWIAEAHDRVDTSTTVRVYAWLTYMWDRSNITDGTVSLNGSAMTHDAGGTWYRDVSQSSVGIFHYVPTAASGNTHGITEFAHVYMDGSGDNINCYDWSFSSHLCSMWIRHSISGTGGDGLMGTGASWTADYIRTNGQQVYVYFNDGDAATLNPGYSWMTTDEWVHIAIRINYSDNNNHLYLYINGGYVATTTRANIGGGDGGVNINGFGLGYAAPNSDWDGEMGDIRVYASSSVSDFEVLGIYQGWFTEQAWLWHDGTSVDMEDSSWRNKGTQGSADASLAGGAAFKDRVSENYGASPIWDRVQVQSYSVSDSRDDINDNVDIDVTLWYDHDNTQLTDGTVTINGYSAAHQGSGVWRITRTSASVTSVTYNTVVSSGNTHGITVVDQNGQSQQVIWDRVQVSGYSVSDAHDNINDNVDIDVTLIYDYDDAQVTDGTVTINGYAAAHQGSGVWRITRTSATVTSVTYNDVQCSGNTYDITEEDQNGQSTTVIWDQIVVQTTVVDDSRIDINTNAEVRVTLWLDYDNSFLGSGDSVTLDGVSMTWDSGNSWFDLSRTQASVGSWRYFVNSSSEATYGITALDVNSKEVDIIWDRIKILTTAVQDGRIDYGTSMTVNVTAHLEYDAHSLGVSDILYMNDTLMTWDTDHYYITVGPYNIVDLINYFVNSSGASEATYSITVVNLDGNDVDIIWDRIKILTTTTQDGRIDYNSQADIRVTAELEYDSHALGASDTLYMNSTSMSWAGSYFQLQPQFAQVGLWNFFVNVSSANEATYGITVVNLNSNNVDQIWDSIVVTADGTTHPDGRANVGEHVTFWATAKLSYDDHPLGSGDYIMFGDKVMTWNGTHFYNDTYTKNVVGNYTFTGNVSGSNEATYGISYLINSPVNMVFDRVLIYSMWTDEGDKRGSYGTEIFIWASLVSEYDNESMTAGIVQVNGTQHVLSGGDINMSYVSGANWKRGYTFSEVVNKTFLITWANWTTYNITEINYNGWNVTYLYQIWDRVTFVMATNMTWTVVTYNINVSYTATHDFDSSTFSGSFTMSNMAITSSTTSYEALTKTSVANYTFYALTVSDSVWSITALSTNTVWCVFDNITATSTSGVEVTDFSKLYFIYFGELKWAFNSSGVGADWKCYNIRNSVALSYATTQIDNYLDPLKQEVPVPLAWTSITYSNNATKTVNGRAYDFVWFTEPKTVAAAQEIMVEHVEILDVTVVVSGTTNVNFTWSVYNAGVASGESGSITNTDDWEIVFSMVMTYGTHNYSIYFNAGVGGTRWFNSSYFIEFDVNIDPPEVKGDNVEVRGTINIACAYYIYTEGTYSNEYGSLTPETFSFFFTKQTTDGLHNYSLYFNVSSSVYIWKNGSYYVATTFTVTVFSITESSSYVLVSGHVTKAANYSTYHENVLQTTGTITSGDTYSIRVTKATSVGDFDWGILFNSTGTTKWVNGTYSVGAAVAFGIDLWDLEFDDVYINIYCTTTYGNATLWIYDNGVLRATSPEAEIVQYRKLSTEGVHNITMLVNATAAYVWKNFTYSIAVLLEELKLTVFTFDTSGIKISGAIQTNWGNATITIQTTAGTTLFSGTETDQGVSFHFQKVPTAGVIHLLTITIDGGGQSLSYTLGYTYEEPWEPDSPDRLINETLEAIPMAVEAALKDKVVMAPAVFGGVIGLIVLLLAIAIGQLAYRYVKTTGRKKRADLMAGVGYMPGIKGR